MVTKDYHRGVYEWVWISYGLPVRRRLDRRCLPLFAFRSTRSFQAVRNAPVRTSSVAALSRMCVIPILPQPPGIGMKTCGSSSKNSACCSGESFRFPYPLSSEASVAKIFPPTRKSACPMCEPSSSPAKLSAMRRKSWAVMIVRELVFPEPDQARAAAASTKISSTSSRGLGKRRKIFQATKLIYDPPGGITPKRKFTRDRIGHKPESSRRQRLQLLCYPWRF